MRVHCLFCQEERDDIMFRILLVEDSESDVSIFRMTVDRLNDSQENEEYQLECVTSLNAAKEKIESHVYDGSVVDIKLGEHDNGNDFITSLMQYNRIPVVVFTGTPDVECAVKIFVKGENTPEDVIEELKNEADTGIFRVLGGKGEMERDLTSIFWNALYPQMDKWMEYKANGIETEKILMRYAVAHMFECCDVNELTYCTEEMYILNASNKVKTGAIFEKISSKKHYMLMSPPCDLVIQDDKPRTDSLLLIEIEEIDWTSIKSSEFDNIIGNKRGYNHWLPDNNIYRGGVLNFRKLITVTWDDFNSQYNYLLKVQESFVKSILQRFSAYYARQGQPDFNSKGEIAKRKGIRV